MKYTHIKLALGLLGVVMCNSCQRGASSSITRGVWHTGTYVRDITPKEYFKDPIKGSSNLEGPFPKLQVLGKHTYKMYRVKHNGSCGFRSFIPAMLEQLLEGGSWKSWIEEIHKKVFEPAQKIIQNDGLDNTKYPVLAPTNNPEELYKQTHALLATLSNAHAPRELQEQEIQTLVKFLRQIILMKKIISCTDKSAIKKKLESFYTETLAENYKKDWWIIDVDFSLLNVPIIIAYAPNIQGKYYHVVYHGMKEDVKTFAKNRRVLVYHHDGAYFDYLVRQ